MKVRQRLVALAAFLFGRREPRPPEPEGDGQRIVPAGAPDRRAENVVLGLLAAAVLLALGFIVVYAEYSPSAIPNELLGICLGLCLACIAAALG